MLNVIGKARKNISRV